MSHSLNIQLRKNTHEVNNLSLERNNDASFVIKSFICLFGLFLMLTKTTGPRMQDFPYM